MAARQYIEVIHISATVDATHRFSEALQRPAETRSDKGLTRIVDHAGWPL